MKKKVLAITMAALMAASLTACGGSAKETTAVHLLILIVFTKMRSN